MKKLLLGIALAALVFTSAHADAQKEGTAAKKADGNEWVTWDDARKKNFVDGFLAGIFHMIEEGVTLTSGHSEQNEEKLGEMALKIDTEKDNPVFTGADLVTWAEMEKKYLIIERNRTLMNYLIRGITDAQIKNGLDSIYADASLRHIAVSDAVYLAKMKASHAREDEIDAIVQYLKEGKKNPKHLKIENEKGELVKFIRFP